MAREGDPTKMGYLNFDPCGMSIINWSQKEAKDQNIEDPQGQDNFRSQEESRWIIKIPMTEEYFKMLTLTPILV